MSDIVTQQVCPRTKQTVLAQEVAIGKLYQMYLTGQIIFEELRDRVRLIRE